MVRARKSSQLGSFSLVVNLTRAQSGDRDFKVRDVYSGATTACRIPPHVVIPPYLLKNAAGVVSQTFG